MAQRKTTPGNGVVELEGGPMALTVDTDAAPPPVAEAAEPEPEGDTTALTVEAAALPSPPAAETPATEQASPPPSAAETLAGSDGARELVAMYRPGEEEQVDVHQPHAMSEEWPANEVLIVGRLQRRRGPAPRMYPTEGGAYTLHTVRVAEEASAGKYGDVAQMRVPLLVPDSLPRQMHRLLERSGLVSIVGRITQQTIRDPRYEPLSLVHGKVKTIPFVKAVDIRAVPNGTPQYAGIRIQCSVDFIRAMNVRIARGRSDRYHTVQVEVRELQQRPAPFQGTRKIRTPLVIAVDSESPEAAYMLRKGNQVQLELETMEIADFLPDTHYALQGVEDDLRDRLRRREHIYLVATQITPLGEATPLSEKEQRQLFGQLRAAEQRRSEARARQAQPPRRRTQ